MVVSNIKPIVLKSKNENWYIYSPTIPCIYPCHKVLAMICKLYLAGIERNQWVKIILDKNESQEQEIHYYLKLFDLLKGKKYFESVCPVHHIDTVIDSSLVKKELFNISQISLEVTQECNLNCTYCAYSDLYNNYSKRFDKKMDCQVAYNAINYFFEYANSKKRISYRRPLDITFYGGEPLLNMNLIKKIVQLSKKKSLYHVPITYTIVTNGILLKEYLEYLIENKFNIYISLDGNYIHNSYRVTKNNKNVQKIVEKNILLIKDKYNDFYSKYVNFNVVLHNLNPIDETINYFINKFKKIPSFSELATNGVSIEKRIFFESLLNNSINKDISSNCWDTVFPKLPHQGDLVDLLHRSTPFVFRDYNNLIYQNINLKRYPTATCLPFSNKVFITAEGRILPCEQVSHFYIIGKIDKHTVRINFDEIAQKYREYFSKIIKQCAGCWKVFHCSKCIFKISDTGDFFSCSDRLNEESFKNFILSGIELLEKYPKTYKNIMSDVYYLKG